MVNADHHRTVGAGVSDAVGGSQREGVNTFGEREFEGVAGGGGPRTAVECVIHAGDAGALPVVGFRQQPADGDLGGLLPRITVTDGHRADGRPRSVNADEEG